MRIVVLGAGAMGCVLGGLLSRVHDVTLVGRDDHVRTIDMEGLRIEGKEEMTCTPKAVTEVEESVHPDIILLTAKAYDTGPSIPLIERIGGLESMVVSMQNGLDNQFLLAEKIPRVVTGLTSWGATMIGPGRVRLAGRGDMVLGSLTGREGDLDLVADGFASAGIRTRLSDDITREVWMKAIVNACINPVTTLLRRENGCLLAPELTNLIEEVCREAVNVARAWEVDIEEEEAFAKVMEVVRETSTNRSSMLQDLERGRRTEIDDITGSITLRGDGRNVNVPVNRALWSLVRSAGR